MNTGRIPPLRLGLLVLLLLSSVVALCVVRVRQRTSSAGPPAGASVAELTRFYRARIAANPANTSAYVELGRIEEGQELYTSALRRLYAARALGASERDIILPIGRSLSRLDRWDQARDELIRACALMPDSVEAAANLAGVYYSSGNRDAASKTLRAFLDRRRGPDGRLRLSSNELHRVMFCFLEAKDMRSAGDLAQEIIRVSPADPGPYAAAGSALLAQGRNAEAVPYLARAAADAPNEAAVAYNYGLALAHCGRSDEALKQFQRCVTLNPNAANAYVQIGAIREHRQEWKAAALAYSSAAARTRTDTRLLYHAGKVNKRAGNADEAAYWFSCSALSAGAYTDALGYARPLLKSRSSIRRKAGLMNTASAYRGLHRLQEYLAAMKQVAGGDTAQDAMVLADAYGQADHLEEQIACLRRALERDPSLAGPVHFQIAETLLRREMNDDAARELELAVAAVPQNAQYHAELGQVYYATRQSGDRLSRAVAQFEQAVRCGPKDAANYEALGLAYAAAGDNRRAASCLEHAIDLEPGYGPSYQELGRVYVQMGDRAAGEVMLSLYRRYIRYDLQLRTLMARADQNRNNFRAQVELADLLARSGDNAGALQSYRAALHLRPRDAETRLKYDRIGALVASGETGQAVQE